MNSGGVGFGVVELDWELWSWIGSGWGSIWIGQDRIDMDEEWLSWIGSARVDMDEKWLDRIDMGEKWWS